MIVDPDIIRYMMLLIFLLGDAYIDLGAVLSLDWPDARAIAARAAGLSTPLFADEALCRFISWLASLDSSTAPPGRAEAGRSAEERRVDE